MKNDQEHLAIATSPGGEPLLLTPGPLRTSTTAKQAILHLWSLACCMT
ncbi:hypothetical protein MGWOODY_XGa512 [hydrothermal vent metagenome]|uniref:Uncharacterized protein n=1 Tax=hydrothermal vent metagenome TaxID=652676 RepID=A0A160TPV1_9ZZZZ|nr:hypothetical protein [Gammaproteobacteria bacterium]